MIVQGERDGQLTLINQTDHSQLVGQMAAHWGNARFEEPRPYESVVRAAIYHDFGWLIYETAPKADPESGRPFSFIQAGPPLDAYQGLVDWMSKIDRYAALIVAMHRTGLWKGRYGVMRYPGGPNPRNPSPEILKFVADSEAWQEQEKQSVDPATLQTNYRLLQVWDLLGLYFCRAPLQADYIDPVPLTYGIEDGARMTITPAGDNRVAFDPYPFNIRPLKVQVRHKHVPAARFADNAQFRKAYFQADNYLQEYELV